MKIVSNKAKCKLCGDIITSIDEELYVYCKCGSIAVSGGKLAILRLGNHNKIMELSEKTYK